MKNFMVCRRTFIATLGIICMTVLGIHNNIDVSLAVMGAVASIAGANASEGIFKKEPK
jgi:hypothetical protein